MFAILRAVFATEPGQGHCCPGLAFLALDGCNTCTCVNSGLKNESMCTRLACLPPERDGWCIPGFSFPAGDGLNTCTCPASGNTSGANCSNLPCPEVPHHHAGRCCPGRLYADDCNTCTCAESGLKSESSCTEIACTPPLLPEDRCMPGLPYPAGDGLNNCRCPASGLKSEASCTSRACSDAAFEESVGSSTVPQANRSSEAGVTTVSNSEAVPLTHSGEATCCPGTYFPKGDGCNTCTCTSSGLQKDAPCTVMACLPTPPPLLQEGRCVPTIPFPKGDGWNTCICPASGFKSEAQCSDLPCTSRQAPGSDILLP